MMMRAAVLTEFGSDLETVQVDRPAPGRSEVLVRVVASGVNPLDAKIRRGQAPHAHVQPPAVLGIDMAGIVEAVGEHVDTFRPGDEVYGMVGGVGGMQGTLAEFVAVDPALLAVKPGTLSMTEAAAIPLAFITAWEALIEQADVHADQRVLVHGGSGGVGYLAIQLALAHGARVWATGSPTSRAAIEAAGATAIDYTATVVEDYVIEHTAGTGFDIVFDTVGGATLDDSFIAAKPYTGHVVSALGWGSHSLAPLSFRNATYSGVFTLAPLLTGSGRGRFGEALRYATRLADTGRLRTRLHSTTFGLTDLADAYAVVESNHGTGKVVIEIGNENL